MQMKKEEGQKMVTIGSLFIPENIPTMAQNSPLPTYCSHR